MPSGLAYKVYRLRVPSSVKLSTGTNESSYRSLPNVAVGEVRTLHARHRERESRDPPSPKDLAQPPPKLQMHRPPGSPRHPEGNRNESTSWKPIAETCSCRTTRSLAGFSEPLPRPTGPNGDLDASIEIAPNHGFHGFVTDDCRRRCCHRRQAAASDPASPPDSTEPDYAPPATTTHALYPIGWIHRRRQRLPAFDASSSAQAMMPSLSVRSRNARPMWGPAGTLPQRCRYGAIPTDPARQETPGTLGTQSVPIGLASQHG